MERVGLYLAQSLLVRRTYIQLRTICHCMEIIGAIIHLGAETHFGGDTRGGARCHRRCRCGGSYRRWWRFCLALGLRLCRSSPQVRCRHVDEALLIMAQPELVPRQGRHLRWVTAGGVNSTLHVLLHRPHGLRGHAQRHGAIILWVHRQRVCAVLLRVRGPDDVRPITLSVHGKRRAKPRIAAGRVEVAHVPRHLTQGPLQCCAIKRRGWVRRYRYRFR